MTDSKPDKPLFFQGKWWFVSEDRERFYTRYNSEYSLADGTNVLYQDHYNPKWGDIQSMKYVT